MKRFIELQYRLYVCGKACIGIDTIKLLANMYLSAQEQLEIFNLESGGDSND